MAPFADFQLNFDAAQFDPRQSEGAVCLSLADYPMEITNIAQVAVKDNPAKGYIEISLTVVDGQYKGAVQKDRLNVYGQEAETTRIGYQRLSAYAHVAGKQTLPNAGALLGTKLIATCGPQAAPNNDKYSEVKMVKDVAGNPPVFGQPGAPQPAPGQPFGQTAAAAAPAGFAAAPTPAATAPAAGAWNNPAQTAAAPATGGFPVQNVPAAAAAPAAAWGTTAQPAAAGAPSWAK